jgi:hypothetical protein
MDEAPQMLRQERTWFLGAIGFTMLSQNLVTKATAAAIDDALYRGSARTRRPTSL